MATHANSTPLPGVAAALMAEAVAANEGRKTTVELLARGLCNAMQEIHGGRWTAAVDHAAIGAFVLVKRETEDRISKPVRGEVA